MKKGTEPMTKTLTAMTTAATDDAYEAFLRSKAFTAPVTGISGIRAEDLNPLLFDFQAAITAWCLRRGRAACWADTGLGKSWMLAEWAQRVCNHTSDSVIIFTPLAVAPQIVAEGAKLGIVVTHCRSQADVRLGINVSNYERIHLFDPVAFAGIILDESSCIKHFTSATFDTILTFSQNIPYRLACTATPAPNDTVEIGTHAEFLGVMSRVEMLATFFCHDGGETSKWRLKGHAEEDFWKWVASWAIACKNPSDLGFDGSRYILPKLHMHEHPVETAHTILAGIEQNALFEQEAVTLTEQRLAKRASIHQRVALVAETVAKEPDEQWVIWCDLNDEGDALEKAIPGAVQISGSDSDEKKERVAADFVSGEITSIITKEAMFGWGMNWQHCARMARVGPNNSYESFYQGARRSWRFGQTRPVHYHLFFSDAETKVVRNLKRKAKEAEQMTGEMVRHMQIHADLSAGVGMERDGDTYRREVVKGERFTAYLGDCVEIMRELPDDSMGFSVFSPPFSSLYTYSASDRDMGNVKNDAEFLAHVRFMMAELYRILMPGRLVAIHCMDLPMSKERDGVIGLRDFPSDLRAAMEAEGFIYHSKVTIWKDPVTAMQRTKALGLLYKQLKKDSAMSRQGIADYLVVMRKPGVNPEPVTKDPDEFPCDLWQNYASPVWMDINPSDTLQGRSVREERDERHICPIQLQVVERAVRLWTNPGDVVFTPFGGIGSEGHVALSLKRQAVLCELKASYFTQLVANCKLAEHQGPQLAMFDDTDPDA